MKSVTSTGKTCKPPYIPNSEKMSLHELGSVYDEIADQYERKTWFDQHILGVARQRKQLISLAREKILDVACGTGLNFDFFPSTSEITAIDLSPRMLEFARRKA